MNVELRRRLAMTMIALVAVGGAACDDSSSESKSDDKSSVSESSGIPYPTNTSVTVQGSVLPQGEFQGEESDPPNEVAPSVTGVDITGESLTIAPSTSGKPMAIVTVAHWCPHCQREVPILSELLNGGTEIEGVEVVFISTAASPERDNYPPSEWLAREGITAPVLADSDDQSAAYAYGVTGFPFITFTTADGTVSGRYSGESPKEDLKARFKKAASAE